MYNPGNSERIAKFVAAFVTFGAVCFFILVTRPEKQPLRRISSVPVAAPRPSLDPPPPPKVRNPNQEFRSVPGRWAPVDFKHYSYGRYKFYDGRKISLVLENGQYGYELGGNSAAWFSLQDVYYFDVTGDDIPDAIVDISVDMCGIACDGGSHLLFIYSIDSDGRVKELFQFKTGSYGYGCGLKSVTLERKKVSLDLFGRCTRPAMQYPGSGKGLIKNLTHLAFSFSHKGFIQTEKKFVSSPETDVNEYKAEFYIHQQPANVIRP
jgi:hypothetical protein